jgi:hypothetical protein
MTILNFLNPKEVEKMQLLASEILSVCNGKTYEEVMDRLGSKLPPKDVLVEIESIWIEDTDKKEALINDLKSDAVKDRN